jgi:hypothetical protein
MPITDQPTSAVNRSLGVCVRCAFLQRAEYFRRKGAPPELREHALVRVLGSDDAVISVAIPHRH